MYPFFFVIFHNFYWFVKVSSQKAHFVNHIITQTWPQLCYKKACCTEAAFSLNWWRWQSLSLSLLCTQQLDVEEAFSWRDAANSKQFLGISKLQDIPYLLQKMSFPLWCVSTCLAVETVLDSRGLLRYVIQFFDFAFYCGPIASVALTKKCCQTSDFLPQTSFQSMLRSKQQRTD